MDGMLSQEEINALLNEPDGSDLGEQPLTDTEKDAIGEVANISMGTAATTLFSLHGKILWLHMKDHVYLSGLDIQWD